MPWRVRLNDRLGVALMSAIRCERVDIHNGMLIILDTAGGLIQGSSSDVADFCGYPSLDTPSALAPFKDGCDELLSNCTLCSAAFAVTPIYNPFSFNQVRI